MQACSQHMRGLQGVFGVLGQQVVARAAAQVSVEASNEEDQQITFVISFIRRTTLEGPERTLEANTQAGQTGPENRVYHAGIYADDASFRWRFGSFSGAEQ